MTKTSTQVSAATVGSEIPAAAAPGHRPRRWILAGVGLIAIIVAAALVTRAVISDDDDGDEWQIADVGGQGGAEPLLASDGARLLRRADGLVGEIDVPTPEPGSYEYPTDEVFQEWADPYHPPVSPGAGDAPEAFTVWMITFNNSSRCTDGECNPDDTQPGAAARGGVYQLDGRVADGETLRFAGNVLLGQQPVFGSPLDDPLHAMVHFLIAPHGRALSGEDLWRQLNGPIGGLGLWWAAEFPAP
jgi:hypothetical protein